MRLTVWRAVWLMLRFNPLLAATYAAMTQAAGAEPEAAQAGTGSCKPGAAARARRAKARVACAASLLRRIYSIVVPDTNWDPAIAAGRHCLPLPPTPAGGGGLTRT